MKELKVILIGAGGRGRMYVKKMMNRVGKFKIVGVAEPIADRRERVRDAYNVPNENCYTTWEDILARPKFADIAIVSTSDALHYEPAMKAIELGYNLLLEKPAAPTPEQCADIANLAKEKGVKILVCHVLRYTVFWSKMKKLIDEGAIGQVVSVQHEECVGNEHHSHSYVRGNWGNTAKSSNMLLAKSCHDIDLIQWLVGSKCKSAASFGSLTYFRKENAPEGSPEYCIEGCPHADTCFYNALKIYGDPNLWYRTRIGRHPDLNQEELEEALRTTQFGKCIFKCDNDVVDHQVVNLEFDNGATASFNMCSFNKGGRRMRIMGTEGEIWGAHGEDKLYYFSFKTRKTVEICPSTEATVESITGGHGGGDDGIVDALYEYMANDIVDGNLSEIGISVENHLITFAAEQARLENRVISFKDYAAQYLK